MFLSTMPRLLIMALLKPPQLNDTSFMADRLQPPTMGNRLAHTYLQKTREERGKAEGVDSVSAADRLDVGTDKSGLCPRAGLPS